MHFEAFSFGSIRIDGVTYGRDVVIDGGYVRKRDKKPSEISPGLRPRAALRRRGNSLEVPAARDRHGGNIQPIPRAGGRLVQDGPYRWIRHPMYTAVMACAGAWAIALPWAWLATLGLAIVLAIKASFEER